ncbi:hypothetical protein B0H11DRAFT_2071869 [Mycena galericulata]|nr:hypothetical protein B0H11DRAFT_2071869 [Mycena galericulata]
MTDVSHNPFRTPAATPNPTGLAPPQTQRYASPATPPPDPTGLTEEVPPAYTAAPDVYQGESTLEYGPSRPFQPAPPPPSQQQYAPPPPSQGGGWVPQQQMSPAPSLWQQLTGQVTGSSAQFPPASWSAYPGHQQQQQYAPPPQPSAPPRPPPPATHISEFARDFYATTDVPPGAFSDVSGARANSSTGPRYPPPPGVPPAARTPSPNRSGGLPDDGRPTSRPVAGHPLLRDGNMLVYPPHFECSKCNNTGYKHADPGHPCNRCWSKYARPYVGALVVATSSPARESPPSNTLGHASPSFQRPLPHIYAPSSSSLSPNGYAPPPQMPGGYPPPPANAIYPPGDPRLGGAVCWRCGGNGTLSFLIFETVPCSVCRGVGRVFG